MQQKTEFGQKCYAACYAVSRLNFKAEISNSNRNCRYFMLYDFEAVPKKTRINKKICCSQVDN